MSLLEFFPEVEPYDTGLLKVSEKHSVYYEQVGNPKGQPILFLHGGPGGGVDPVYRRYFDPKFYRIILFDQRGCGKSLPLASLEENTTWDLVNDIEKLRERFQVKKWIVFGGSWGSTLALAYAIKHTEVIQGLILRGIFLCRPSEINWFYQNGASNLFPEFWDKYLEPIATKDRSELVPAYYRLLTSSDAQIRLKAAKAWSQWEAATSRLYIKPEAVEEFEDPDKALAFARIECHYFMNNAFFPTNNYLLEQAYKIKNIPGEIIQGRYDVVCPATSAWDLHKHWSIAKFTIVADAGHASSEPGIRSALIAATERFKEQIGSI